MSRRSKIWLVAAGLFILGNLAGGVFAAARGEMRHAGVHAGLLLLGVYLVWQLAPRRDPLRLWRSEESLNAPLPQGFADRLTHLEQSLDAVAIEVERIGESQRFMARLFKEDGTLRAPRESAPEPIERKAE